MNTISEPIEERGAVALGNSAVAVGVVDVSTNDKNGAIFRCSMFGFSFLGCNL